MTAWVGCWANGFLGTGVWGEEREEWDESWRGVERGRG